MWLPRYGKEDRHKTCPYPLLWSWPLLLRIPTLRAAHGARVLEGGITRVVGGGGRILNADTLDSSLRSAAFRMTVGGCCVQNDSGGLLRSEPLWPCRGHIKRNEIGGVLRQGTGRVSNHSLQLSAILALSGHPKDISSRPDSSRSNATALANIRFIPSTSSSPGGQLQSNVGRSGTKHPISSS